MKKLIFICFAMVFGVHVNGQVKQTIQQPTLLTGVVHKDDFSKPPYSFWFERNYNNYNPDEQTISEIKKYIDGVTIKAFMGTWCGDSKRETPQLYKILELTGFDESNLEMITMNRSKKTPEKLEEGLDIFRVPTFIFYRNNEEIGRYVEYPQESLEEDILKILSGKPYKHSYEN